MAEFLAVWDQEGKKFYETGTDRGMLYPYDKSKNGYGDGVVWDGLTQINDSPSGADPTDLWADNVKYLSIRSAEQYGFTINAYQAPKEFDECDGAATPVTGVKIGQQNRKMFGFSYRSLVGNDTEYNDHGYKIHLIYGATCSPSTKDRSTVNDSPDAVEFSWECTTTPVPVPGFKPTATIEIDSRDFADPTNSTRDAALKKGLNEFELKIYGEKGASSSADKKAMLPSPSEVINFFKELFETNSAG